MVVPRLGVGQSPLSARPSSTQPTQSVESEAWPPLVGGEEAHAFGLPVRLSDQQSGARLGVGSHRLQQPNRSSNNVTLREVELSTELSNDIRSPAGK